MASARFLSADDLHTLTGYVIKAKQAEQLRRMGIPFFVNGHGKPVVAASAVEGGKTDPMPQAAWKPAVIHGGMSR